MLRHFYYALRDFANFADEALLIFILPWQGLLKCLLLFFFVLFDFVFSFCFRIKIQQNPGLVVPVALQTVGQGVVQTVTVDVAVRPNSALLVYKCQNLLWSNSTEIQFWNSKSDLDDVS